MNVDIRDHAIFDEYKARVLPLIKKHGGEYLARGGSSLVLEGNWHPSRLVIIRFPDTAATQGFYNDPEYQPLIELRQRGSSLDMVIVDGI